MIHKYIANTESDIKEMLDVIGAESTDDLFKDIPENIRFTRDYDFEDGLSELEVTARITALSEKNLKTTCFLGAGAYDHYIPSITKHIAQRSEFSTAYTPYQPEVAQGTLQYIFEYQTMICNLTGMHVSNASLYDGATGTAEAMMMACGAARRSKVLVSDSLNPNTIAVVKTYARFRDLEVEMIETIDGALDVKDLEAKLNKDIAAVIVQNPNFFGIIEDTEAVVDMIHKNKSLLIMNVNLTSLALIKTPGEIGADIVCGDAQVLGIPMSFGGPYLGFFASTKKLLRKMPGRICGMTKDASGKRSYVLTLQAREQHIRREKATSNICSNQSLLALCATVYMATLGKQGLNEVATQCVKKAHYAQTQITALDRFEAVFTSQPFFHEFAVKTDIPAATVKKALTDAKMLGGLDLEKTNNLPGHLLFCVTEKRTKEEIDALVQVLGGIK